MATTTRLGTTLLEIAQATKEVTINEALWRIDALCGGVLKDITLTAPDGGEVEGDLYYCAGVGTGDWTGFDYDLPHYYNGAWVAYPLQIGMTFRVTGGNLITCTGLGPPPTWGTITVT